MCSASLVARFFAKYMRLYIEKWQPPFGVSRLGHLRLTINAFNSLILTIGYKNHPEHRQYGSSRSSAVEAQQ